MNGPGRLVRTDVRLDPTKWALPADTYRLRSPASFLQDVLDLVAEPGCRGTEMPAPKTHGMLQFRPAEVSLWAGYKGSYKSTFLSELAAHWACTGTKVAIASLEMPGAVLLKKMVQQAVAKETVDERDVLRAIEAMEQCLTIYDFTGRAPAKNLLAIMRYVALEYGVQHFILDNLTKVLSVDNDRSAEHQDFVNDCCLTAQVTGLHIHLVAHCAKPENGDERKIPGGYNIRGTGAVPDMVDNVLILWRNKEKERRMDAGTADSVLVSEPDIRLVVDKQRNWQFEGQFNYWLQQSCLRFCEHANREYDAFV